MWLLSTLLTTTLLLLFLFNVKKLTPTPLWLLLKLANFFQSPILYSGSCFPLLFRTKKLTVDPLRILINLANSFRNRFLLVFQLLFTHSLYLYVRDCDSPLLCSFWTLVLTVLAVYFCLYA